MFVILLEPNFLSEFFINYFFFIERFLISSHYFHLKWKGFISSLISKSFYLYNSNYNVFLNYFIRNKNKTIRIRTDLIGQEILSSPIIKWMKFGKAANEQSDYFDWKCGLLWQILLVPGAERPNARVWILNTVLPVIQLSEDLKIFHVSWRKFC